MGSDAGRFRWWFLEADEAERGAFADLRATTALAGAEPVAPPNTLRDVWRVAGPDGRVYFLKRFRRVQAKNLLRNLATPPRCTVDASREAGVASALRAAGIRAPRPVAVGRSGLGSALLLAEMPGEPLRERLAAGRCPRALADRVADHCGALFRRGFVLPDLSTDHVFVDGEDPASCELGVLDLHDGRLGAASARDLRRCLRRFGRSVRGLDLPRTATLRFAVRFLRAAGRPAWSRRLLERVPPLDTHGRYDLGGRAARYAVRNPARTAAEVELLRRVWPGRPGESVLDLPCGAARLIETIRATGAAWHGADRARGMLEQAQLHAGAAAPLCCADAREMPFRDASFDGVVVFRFLHHLPPDQARQAVDEACRVAARFVVVSFFHPVSAHNLTRRLRERLQRRPRARHSILRGTLDGWMRRNGFHRTATAAQAPLLRDLWVATYQAAASARGVTRPPA